MRHTLILAILSIPCCLPLMAHAAVVHVPADQPTIQAGIDAAADGDTVLVAAGVYTGEGNQDIDFNGKAINLLSEDGPALTVIDCEGSAAEPHRGFIFQNEEGTGSVISGFTIRNGYAVEGGAIYCHYPACSPTIEGNIITGNTAEQNGGGIYACYGSEAVIRGNTISNNRTLSPPYTSYGGGGICAEQSSPVVENNTVVENHSASYGGGLCITGSSVAGPCYLANTLIAQNQSEADGGGIYLYHTEDYLYFTGCTITDNRATQLGGGFCNTWGSDRIYFDDCIIWGNQAPEGPQGYIRHLAVFNYCDVEGGQSGIAGDDQVFWGDGNLDLAPIFAHGPLGHYFLSQTAAGQPVTSPCVDAGTPGSPVPDGTTRTDLAVDGTPRDIGFHYPILPDPHLRFEPGSFAFYARLEQGDPPDQQLRILNGGLGTLAWVVHTDAPWLTLDPLSGSTSGGAADVLLTVDATGLPHGEYQAAILITAPGAQDAPQTVPVSLSIHTEFTIDATGGGDFTAIQPALDAAVNGDLLVVAAGTYNGPLNRDLDFHGKRIRLESAGGPVATIIDCEGLGRGISFEAGEGEETGVRGLTITNGSAGSGGGILCGMDTSPVLENIHLVNCHAEADGGGLFCDPGSVVRFSGEFRDNEAGGYGGGCTAGSYASLTVYDSLISGNRSGEYGGGIAALTSGTILVLDSTITGNHSASGGGISTVTYGIVRGNTIRENSATSYGGGLLIQTTTGATEISGNLILDNSARAGGGMRTSSSVGAILNSNNLFTGNVATEDGGGIYCGSTADGLSSCTFRGNKAGGRGGGIYCYETNIRNCIVGENSAPEGPAIYMSDGSYLSIYFSNVDRDQIDGAGTLYWREGNITADPLFISGPLGASYLSQYAAGQHVQSPCVDAGDPQGELVDGTTRTDIVPDEGIPDMGFHYPLETVAGNALIVTGPGPVYGNPPRIRVFPAEQDAGYISEFAAYGIGHYGALVATGEFDGDFGSEIVTGAGPGDVFGPHVRGFEADGSPLPGLSFLAYATRRFGVNVAAGDLDGDRSDEIITGAGPGEVFGPHVRAFNYDGGPSTAPVPGVSFLAYGTPKWGVNVAAGDVDGDGYDEIVTGPGPGGIYGPHVRGWNVDGGAAVPISRISFMAYGTNALGVVVSCGDVDGDGMDEIITGPGPGAQFGAHVRGWNFDGSAVSPLPGLSFFAWPSTQYRYGVRIAAGADLDDDGRADIVTGPGPDPSAGTSLRVFTYDGSTVSLWLSNEAYPAGLTHGTNVASGRF